MTDLDTVIVGAGFAGIGAGIRLSRLGEHSFVVLERAEAIGGTWRDNVYPGVACDIPSHLYSFSFAPKHDWSHFFARGSEIQDYLRECAREIDSRLRLGTDVLEMRWLADIERWLVRTSAGDYTCRTLVVAAGRLSEPRMPEIPGLNSFPGAAFHSSRYDHDVRLAGKRVGVVGTGASAVQLVPRVAEQAGSVVLFQRTAPYVVPRDDVEYSARDILNFRNDPEARERLRADLFWAMEAGFAERVATPGYIDALRDRARGHLEAQVSDAALREALTPDYEIGCKRVLLADDFYPALESGAVTITAALERVDGPTAIAANGAAHDLDVLVFATGFESTRPPFARRVFGRDGLSLDEAWRDGMVAYASTTVHGFPNLFVIDGPNASLGHNSAIVMIEAQIDYLLGALHDEIDVLEVSADAQAAYVADLDARAASTVWLGGGCESWYVDERSRRLTLLWPDFAYAFRDRLSEFDRAAYL
ncbi:NAD(P)/FAD-dependent oxidoreductase [Conyzicola nivalis]|uniref:Monooxygenase n=1 Tax=Conyzicola nivalis TaxID=1477021 RepID=A0A916WL99_9MICO|nr:NAD(P)/FAD-dependent oxidoreductase [Conyzicola nivalis]GGB08501.1 monooxygenase [Conyzicola nivalis]